MTHAVPGSRRVAKQYARLMAQAADGSVKAAKALMLGEWWPGDPDDDVDVRKIILLAQSVRESDAKKTQA